MLEIEVASIDLVIAERHGRGYAFHRVLIAPEFATALGRIVDAADNALAACGAPKPYSIGDEIESDECMVAPLRRAESAAPLMPDAISPTEASRAMKPRKHAFAMTEDPIDFRRRLVTTVGPQEDVGRGALAEAVAGGHISFYAIVKGTTNADRLAYVRHMNPARLNKPGNLLARLGDTLTALSEPIFVIDDRTDLIIRTSDIIVFNKSFFDSLFFGLSGDGEELDEMVNTALSVLPFQQETQAMLVEKSRGRKRMRRKMIEISESGHLATVTIDDFKNALDAVGVDHSRFIAKDGHILSSEEDGEFLLQILNEDIFHGLLTGRRLAATRKNVRP